MYVAIADQFRDALLLNLVILDHQQTLDGPIHELVQRRQRFGERLLGRRLGEEVDRSETKSTLPVLLHRYDVNRDMAGCRVVFETVENSPPVRIGQPQIQCDGRGVILLGKR